VPACGASTRMGQPKGLLDFEGRSFARRAVEALREGGCHRVLVVTRVGDAALQNEATAAGAQILENPSPGSGPITSLRLALQSLPSATSHVVWLPLDHPTVSSESIRAVVAAAQSGDAAVALPVHDGRRGHPPCSPDGSSMPSRTPRSKVERERSYIDVSTRAPPFWSKRTTLGCWWTWTLATITRRCEPGGRAGEAWQRSDGPLRGQTQTPSGP
jgi:hypothetical protein